MKRSINKLLGAVALSFFGLAAQAQDIKLGFNGDLSASPSALSGQAAVLGLQAAIDDVNAAGGVLGRKLTLVVRDDLSQPPKSIQNMSDLIDNEKVVTVFGPTNSGNALAWKQVPNQKKIPVIGTVGSGTAITYPASAGADNYMSEPKLLLLDEPSLGLAPLIIRDIFNTIRALRGTGLTILLVEQMANQALGVADRAYVLETGSVTLQGKGSDLLKDPKVRAAYLGTH